MQDMGNDKDAIGTPLDVEPDASGPATERDALEEALDEALDESFPASDPPAMSAPGH